MKPRGQLKSDSTTWLNCSADFSNFGLFVSDLVVDEKDRDSIVVILDYGVLYPKYPQRNKGLIAAIVAKIAAISISTHVMTAYSFAYIANLWRSRMFAHLFCVIYAQLQK
jgi:hypothetical protein